MGSERPTTAGEYKVPVLAKGSAAVGYGHQGSRATVLWVFEVAFDASVMHHTDPGEGALQPLSLVRPCI